MRPDLPQPTHGIEEEDTLGDILFLRLKDNHLHKFEIPEGLTVTEYLLGDPML